MGVCARAVRTHPCGRLLQAVTMAATRGINAKDVFIDAVSLCADRGGVEPPLNYGFTCVGRDSTL